MVPAVPPYSYFYNFFLYPILFIVVVEAKSADMWLSSIWSVINKSNKWTLLSLLPSILQQYLNSHVGLQNSCSNFYNDTKE